MNKFTNTRGAAALLMGAIALTVASTVSASAANCSYVFTKTLSTGSKGAEVMNLQKVLNMDAATQVAASGAGSAGMETMTFGGATKAAVIKFQAAKGIKPTSGMVGALTRAELNKVCTGTGTTTGSTSTTTGPVSVMTASSQPANVIVSGQSGAVLGNFTFTGNGTVQNLQLTRTGVSANDTLVNVYLYDGATRLTDAASVSSDGIIRINNANIVVSGSRTVTVRADIKSSTNGQLVGVNVTNLTVAGAASSTTVNAVGPILNIASVTTATFAITNNSISTTSGSPSTVNAGTNNQTLLDFTANVGTRAVWLKGLTYKYVGSAPTSAVTNIGLYIDGVKVGTGTINANNRVVFDMTSSPVNLQTGNRQFQLRGDIVGGSYRQFQFSIENMADVMAEDSNLTGVNVTPTGVSFPVLGTYFSVQQGSLTVNLDPSFTATKLVGGASNAVIGQFKYTAYGEDEKIETLTVTPTWTVAPTPNTNELQNVTLYVNGAAVGSQQNWTGSALTFNLGSQFIVPAGTSAIFMIKADLRNAAGTNYTAGTLRTDNAVTIARGQSSQNSTTVSTVSGRVLTVASANVAFAKTSGFVAQNVSPNTAAVKVGSFTVQASDAEDVVVTNLAATVTIAGAGNVLTNYSNLKLADSSVIYGQLLSSAHNFSMNVTVPKNTTKSFDVYADLGSVPANGTIQVDGVLTYRGVNSGITTTTSSATGVLLTANTATLAAPTLVASSPVQQLVTGGTTNAALATFNVKATSGNATITDLGFTTTPSDAITAITVGGVTSPVVAGGTTYVRGLNLALAQGNGGLDIPVTVTYGSVASNGGIASQTSALTSLTLSYLKAMSGNTTLESGVSGYGAFATVASNAMQLVASKPTVTVANTTVTGLNLSAENKIGEVTVSADAAGNITLKKLTFSISNSGFSTAPTAFSGARLADGNSTISDADCSALTAATGGACTFTTGYTIAAGTSKTFSLFATMTGAANTGTSKAQLSTKVLGTSTNFQWIDVNGSATVLNGTNIYNFPTNSYTVTQ